MGYAYRRYNKLLAGLLLLQSMIAFADQEDIKALQATPRQWELIRVDKLRQIEVYTKREDDRRIRSMKAEAEIPASINDIVALLMDFNRYPEWFWRVKEVRLLKQVSEHEAYVYMAFNPPLGFPDRDVILHYTVDFERNGQRATVHASGVADYLPPQAGRVRMPYAELDSKLAVREDGRVYFRGEVVMDPAGDLPVWASNLVQRQGPYITMLNFIKALERKNSLEQALNSPRNSRY